MKSNKEENIYMGLIPDDEPQYGNLCKNNKSSNVQDHQHDNTQQTERETTNTSSRIKYVVCVCVVLCCAFFVVGYLTAYFSNTTNQLEGNTTNQPEVNDHDDVLITKDSPKKISTPRTKIFVFVLICCGLFFAAGFLTAYFIFRTKDNRNYDNSVSGGLFNYTTSQVTMTYLKTTHSPTSTVILPESTTTTTASTTISTSLHGCPRQDIVIITDEWNVQHTFTLMAEVVTELQRRMADFKVGIITQGRNYMNTAFNISLTSPEEFLNISSQHSGQFCCAKVAEVVYQGNEMLGISARPLAKRIILFVSLYNYQTDVSIDAIRGAANSVLDQNVDKIIAAGFLLDTAQNTISEVEAVTTNTADRYGFTYDKTNQTLTAQRMVENSFC